jgi:hypothetical protein
MTSRIAATRPSVPDRWRYLFRTYFLSHLSDRTFYGLSSSSNSILEKFVPFSDHLPGFFYICHPLQTTGEQLTQFIRHRTGDSKGNCRMTEPSCSTRSLLQAMFCICWNAKLQLSVYCDSADLVYDREVQASSFVHMRFWFMECKVSKAGQCHGTSYYTLKHDPWTLGRSSLSPQTPVWPAQRVGYSLTLDRPN